MVDEDCIDHGSWEYAVGAFAAALDRLGPFEPMPSVAVAVSGGADSLAASLLTRDWVRKQSGTVMGLVVDHGLRTESAAEAELTCDRLAGLGITPCLLTLRGLARGPGLAARAREARHDALERACRAAGIVHLIYGHHALDQAETTAIRRLAGSGPSGLAGMAALVEMQAVRRLRPLLGFPPALLRAVLRHHGVGWVEDPSNTDLTQTRARLRWAFADPSGTGEATRAAVAGAQALGLSREAAERQDAAALAGVEIRPEGFARIPLQSLPASALARLLGMIAGAQHPPSLRRVSHLAPALKAATLAGVRVMAAGRLGAGWLLLREEAAMQPPIPAIPGAIWDGRYRLTGAVAEGATLGAWGAEARAQRPDLPMAVLRTLPALRENGVVISVGPNATIRHAPRHIMTSAPFLPA
jgi:tRNA(Ile)-lysidine synthase